MPGVKTHFLFFVDFPQVVCFQGFAPVFGAKMAVFPARAKPVFPGILKKVFAGKANNDRPPGGGTNLWTNFALM